MACRVKVHSELLGLEDKIRLSFLTYHRLWHMVLLHYKDLLMLKIEHGLVLLGWYWDYIRYHCRR
jgi:hypothetical protein